MPLDLQAMAPLAHLSLLTHHPERLLALRLAMSRRIGPESSVLDAGCGALGAMSIMAARRLAEENLVADRVTFVESDLDDLDAGLGPFDVILGMLYTDDPRQGLER